MFFLILLGPATAQFCCTSKSSCVFQNCSEPEETWPTKLTSTMISQIKTTFDNERESTLSHSGNAVDLATISSVTLILNTNFKGTNLKAEIFHREKSGKIGGEVKIVDAHWSKGTFSKDKRKIVFSMSEETFLLDIGRHLLDNVGVAEYGFTFQLESNVEEEWKFEKLDVEYVSRWDFDEVNTLACGPKEICAVDSVTTTSPPPNPTTKSGDEDSTTKSGDGDSTTTVTTLSPQPGQSNPVEVPKGPVAPTVTFDPLVAIPEPEPEPNWAAIIGGTVGGVLLVFCCIIMYCMWRMKLKKKENHEAEEVAPLPFNGVTGAPRRLQNFAHRKERPMGGIE